MKNWQKFIIYVVALLEIPMIAWLASTNQDLRETNSALQGMVNQYAVDLDIAHYDVDRFEEAFDSKEKELSDAENQFVEYMVKFVSYLASDNLTEHDITQEYLDGLRDRLAQPTQVPEVGNPIEVIRQLEGWNSLVELADFLSSDNTDKQIFASLDHPDGNNTCALYAFRLRLNAETVGKYISWQLISDADYELLLSGELPDYDHIMCMASIDGKFYLIEPQDDKIWEVAQWRD